MAPSKQRYECKITLGKQYDGTPIRKSFYSTKSLADARKKAEKYRREYELEIMLCGDSARQTMLFRKWSEICLDRYKKPYVKGNTFSSTWKPAQAHLDAAFGDTPVDSIRPIDVQGYVNRAVKRYKPETIKKDITALSFIMQHAAENGLCKQNPVTSSIQLPKVQRAEKIAYTSDQYQCAYEFAKGHKNGLSIMIMLETGISRSELLGLTWEDFDSENAILHIRQGLVSYSDTENGWTTVADGLKNEYRHRSIPIVEPELLARLRNASRTVTVAVGGESIEKSTNYIIHSPEGHPYQPSNWNHRVFVPFMNELHKAHPGIPKLSAHECRHTRASLWMAGGMSAYTAAKLLGHSDTRMLLKIYDHTDVETLRSAISAATN